MKQTKENGIPKNPYANNKGGQIRAPFKGENEVKGQKIVGKNDLRVKK